MSDANIAEREPDAILTSKPAAPRQTLGTIALLVALLALLAAGWAGWQVRGLSQIPARIDLDGNRLAALSGQLEKQSTASKQQLADITTSLEDGLATISLLTNRIQANEKQLENLPAMDADSRSNWLKAQALNYLQIANAQALFADNPDLAIRALQLADDNLRDAGDPAMAPVRAQLASDMTALRALPRMDHAGIAFRLQALAAQANTWPFRGAAPDRFAPESRATTGQGIVQQPLERLISTLKTAFSSIVSIKKTDIQSSAQLGSAERALIVAALDAELQLARLALLANDAKGFRQSLQRVSEQLQQYFDRQDSAVGAAIDTLQELQAMEFPGPLPDISGALALMLSDSAETPPAALSEAT